MSVNQELVQFFVQHYAPGRVALVGATDLIGRLIREGQAGLTEDRRPSRWSHTFLLGMTREDGRGDGNVYIFESDLRVSTSEWQIENGSMESRVVKWCRDDIEHACVLGLDLSAAQRDAVVRTALHYAYEYEAEHLRYPIGELFGTFWAILTRRMNKRNIFDERFAVQCATFVRMCYRDGVGVDPIPADVALSNTSPEAFYQSHLFSFREEWHRG